MTCPACTAKCLHTSEDWKLHPYAGHGYASGQGWTHPDLAPAQHNGAVSLKLTEMEQGLLGKGLDPGAPVGGKS